MINAQTGNTLLDAAGDWGAGAVAPLNAYPIYNKLTVPEVGTPVIGVIDGDTIVVGNKYVFGCSRSMRRIRALQWEGSESRAREARIRHKRNVCRVHPDQQGVEWRWYTRNMLYMKKLEGGKAMCHHDASSKKMRLRRRLHMQKTAIWGFTISAGRRRIQQNIPETLRETSMIKERRFISCRRAQYKFVVIEKNRGEEYSCTITTAREAGQVKVGRRELITIT